MHDRNSAQLDLPIRPSVADVVSLFQNGRKYIAWHEVEEEMHIRGFIGDCWCEAFEEALTCGLIAELPVWGLDRKVIRFALTCQ